MIWTSKHVSGKRSPPWPENDGDNDKQRKRTPCKKIPLSFSWWFDRDAACRDPNGSKPTWWCQGPSVVPLSLYSAEQRAGDSYYQQVTVAVLNAGQMAIQGVVFIQLGEGGDNKVRLRLPGNKSTLGTMCHSMQPWCETLKAVGEAGFFPGAVGGVCQ